MKRKCGTCKYFEDRGVANSGTCQHIQRRELRDVVLVRQSELACRNSWDQDLWEPSDSIAADEQDSPGVAVSDGSRRLWEPDEVFRGAEDVPMLPRYGEEVDRVTDIQMPVMRHDPAPWQQPGISQQAAAESEDEDWTARPSVYDVRKRREEQRRQLVQERQAAELEQIERQMTSREAVGASQDTVEAWSAERPSLTFGRAQSQTESAGNGSPTPSDTRRRDLRLEGSVYVDPPANYTAPTNVVSQGTEPLPTEEVQQALGHSRTQSSSEEPVVHVDGGVYGASRSGLLIDAAMPSNPTIAALSDPYSNDPVDRDERAGAIRRCCGTCRDFRQVGDGTRGQCVNPYAFSERRMVQSDQLACRSSLGMWWMPSDEVWLERADTSHHGRPTPLLDAAMKAEKVSNGGRDSHRWE